MMQVILNRTLAAPFLFLMLFFASQSAFSRGTGIIASRCKPEIEKFCAGKEHTQGEIRKCLEKEKAQLSPSCQDAIEGRRSRTN